MPLDACAACRVVLGDGGQDNFHATALAEKSDRTFVSQGLCELADVCVRLSPVFGNDPRPAYK
jgi:hypothetical protein